MDNNELLRSLRKILAANETAIHDIFALGGTRMDTEQARHRLRHPNEPGFQPCSDEELARFLEGLILQRRGKRNDSAAPSLLWPLDNNQILKKLRIAFELHDDALHDLLASAGQPLSKQALSALFRSPGHKNFQPCSDPVLRAILHGLSERLRPG